MTRLVADDISTINDDWHTYDEIIGTALGVDLLELAAGSIGQAREKVATNLAGRKLAAISISSGEGLIGGFAESLAAIGRHLGLEAKAMAAPDEKGFTEAKNWGADFIIYADDHQFIAQNTKTGRQADNNPATSEVFVHALELLHGAPLTGCEVLVLGLGIIGRRAARKLAALGATPLLFDPCTQRSQEAAKQIQSKILRKTELASALRQTGLVFDATPISVAVPTELWPESSMCVAAPGVPLSWPTTWLTPSTAKQNRLWHDPLQSGTAAMLAYVAI